MDSSFQTDKMVIDASFTHDSHVFSRGVAISLLQSSCVIFSEWLAVGGSGVTEIAQAASAWCDVFANQDRALQVELVPTFLRLEVHLAKISSNFSVLGRLLVTCDETDEMDETTLFKKTIASLLTGRDQSGNSMLGGLLEEILKAVRVIIDDEGPANNHVLRDAPSCWEEVCGFKRGFIVPVLSAVGSNKKACVALTDMLVAALQKGPDENIGGEMVLFQVRCLWFLCEAGSDQGATQKAVRSLSGKCQFDAEVQDAVESLTSFYT
ncbi:Condensin II non structural maintenance of chromosomes subunit [Fragilaria crotonensis]|nr:Condensin II non structural maintenance of chromosomes subunit [Fragilaria crotonensis]